MPVNASVATVKINGAAVAMTGEACSNVSGLIYRPTNAAHRIFDPATALVVKDGVTPIAPANVVVDYLAGTVTLSGAPGGSVTIDGAYLPQLAVLEVHEFSAKVSRKLVDNNACAAADVYSRRVATLLDFDGSFKCRSMLTADQDPGAGTVKLGTLFDGSTPVMYEQGVSPNFLRAWVLLESTDPIGAEGDLIDVSIAMKGCAQLATGTGRTERVLCAFVSTT